MMLVLGQAYELANGMLVNIDGATPVVGGMSYFRGTTQRGDSLSFDINGNHQSLGGKTRIGFDIVARAINRECKVMVPGAQWITPGDRIWEVVAICRDEKFPIIANEVLPDGTLHANIKRFDWDGKAHDGSASFLWKRVS